MFRFSLRSFFLALTLTAICVASKLAVFHIFRFHEHSETSSWLTTWGVLQLPVILVCVIGGLILSKSRAVPRSSTLLALVALILYLTWNIFGPLLNLFYTNAVYSTEVIRIGNFIELTSSTVNAALLGLFVVALLRANLWTSESPRRTESEPPPMEIVDTDSSKARK